MRTGTNRFPVWALVGTVIFAGAFVSVVVVYVPYALTRWRFGPPLLGLEATRWIGGGLIILAAPLMLDFLTRFVREGHGTPAPFAPPRRLVVRGPFRYVRNPAYIAAVVSVLGQGLLFGSAEVAAYAIAGAVFFHFFVVLYEEPTLQATFGAEYEQYRREVPRWLPRLRRAPR